MKALKQRNPQQVQICKSRR